MIEDAIDEKGKEGGRFGASWLIVRDDAWDGGGPPEVLTLGAEGGAEGGGKTLPVFSFEEEALLFLRLGGLEGRWRATETDAADLAVVLAESCPDARRVALDPIPEIGPHGPQDLVSLPRKRFVELLAVPRRPEDG